MPTKRLLNGYSLDPSFSTRLDTAEINSTQYKILWEDVTPGPVGEYLEIIDYDPASGCYYEPVDLNDISILAENGLNPSEGNPQFHQQFVYTIMMNTIAVFERALGRKIIWKANDLKPKDTSDDSKKKYIKRLRVYPHAFRDANAFYESSKRAILFGYFEAVGRANGANFPNGLVFTCLSPDIIGHETTHALLDSIHPCFLEDTNPDMAAFHEGFADIVALLNRFSMTSVLEHQIAQTSGRFDSFNVMGELATQFGEALGSHRGALRSAIGRYNEDGKWERQEPDPSDYLSMTEAHDKGALLVATVFDAFIKLYNYRTKDLLRIATNGTGILPQGAISTDLTRRLACEAAEIAQHLLRVCIRALDFCPPLDLDFGDYLRALITADTQINPDDEFGYRVSLIDAFRARGIFPDGLKTLSVESLLWNKPVFINKNKEAFQGESEQAFQEKRKRAFQFIAEELKPAISLLADITDREKIYDKAYEIQEDLKNILKGKHNVVFNATEWGRFLNELGLTAELKGFKYENKKVAFKDARPELQVYKIRPTFKYSSEGKIIHQVIITLMQTAIIKGETLNEAVFRGGCSIIMSLDETLEIEYIISKSINSKLRFQSQMDYATAGASDEDTSLSMYDDDRMRPLNLNLSKIHSAG